jgi:hypothetical protein
MAIPVPMNKIIDKKDKDSSKNIERSVIMLMYIG